VLLRVAPVRRVVAEKGVTPSESHERGEGDATGAPRVRDQWEGFSAPGDARGVPDANESARTSAWKQTKSVNIIFRQSTNSSDHHGSSVSSTGRGYSVSSHL